MLVLKIFKDKTVKSINKAKQKLKTMLYQQSKIECREKIKRSNGNQIEYRTIDI